MPSKAAARTSSKARSPSPAAPARKRGGASGSAASGAKAGTRTGAKKRAEKGLGWDSRWNEQFEQVQAFLKKNGGRWPKAGARQAAETRLGQWCQRQREKKDAGALSKERIALLRQAGFTWDKPDLRGGNWKDQYQSLIAYRKSSPDSWPRAREDFPKGNRLGLWAWRQRQSFQAGELSKERAGLLKKIGFPLALPEVWQEQFKRLKEFRRKNGGRWPKAREEYPEGNRLGLWCHLQRTAYKAGKLKDDRLEQMEKIGFPFSVRGER